MTFKAADRIFETSTTTGTGTYTLDGAQTGYQAFSVLGDGASCEAFVTDGTNWEAGVYIVRTGPARLERARITGSSNAGAEVNWGSGTRNLYQGRIAEFGVPRKTTKNVAGSSNVALTDYEQRCQILVLTGALTGNIDVTVDATVWEWVVYNNTSGNYTLTMKVGGQSGVVIGQGTHKIVYVDGTDVRAAQTTAADAAGADGTVYTADSTATDGGSFKPNAALKNYIINGGCQIAQYPQVVTPADGVFIVGGTDMAASACTNRTSMTLNNAGGMPTVTGHMHDVLLTTSAAGTVAAGFRIDSFNATPLNGKTVTFKCMAWQNSGGTLQARLRIRKPGASNDFTTLTTLATSADFSVADSTGVEASLTVALGANDAGNGLQVDLEYTTAAAVTGKNFRIGDVRLVEGSVAPAFAAEDMQAALAKCEKYLEFIGSDLGSQTVFVDTYSDGSNVCVFNYAYRQVKLYQPTVTVVGGVTYSNTGTSLTFKVGLHNLSAFPAASGAGRAYWHLNNNTKIILDSRLK